MSEASKSDLIELTAEIAAAYVENNKVEAAELANLISTIHRALAGVGNAAPPAPAEAKKPAKPAAPIRRSVTDDFIICLEDGRKFKSLRRHLRTKYNLSPEDYRAKWGLPKDYPMVAPAYAAERSALAKAMGLGQGGRRPPNPAKKPAAAKAEA